MTGTETIQTGARLVARADLGDNELASMFGLLSSYFDGVTREHFRSDLAGKNWVILIERAGALVGFTTILAYETRFDGEPVSVIYSGDTIVAPQAWNSQTLPRAWIESVALLRREFQRGLYVWLLITSGFRTYRFLPVFWRSFFPRYDCQTPPRWKRLIEHLAQERFGDQYEPLNGIVKLRNPQRLNDDLTGIPPGRCDDPHVGFFAHQNPRHADGDELVCLTELSPDNLTSAGRRMASTFPQW